MKRRMSLVTWAILATLLLGAASEAQARGPLYEHSLWTKMSRKGLRGCGNVALGWVEIPLAVNEEWQSLDPFTGTAVGLVKGLGRGVTRTVVGAVEIVTFPFPLPQVEYGPLYRPEFVMQHREDPTSLEQPWYKLYTTTIDREGEPRNRWRFLQFWKRNQKTSRRVDTGFAGSGLPEYY